jgi:hypothetical protein
VADSTAPQLPQAPLLPPDGICGDQTGYVTPGYTEADAGGVDHWGMPGDFAGLGVAPASVSGAGQGTCGPAGRAVTGPDEAGSP